MQELIINTFKKAPSVGTRVFYDITYIEIVSDGRKSP